MTALTMNDRAPDARFWDRISGYYSRKAVPDEAAYQRKLDATDAYLTATDRVLEVGCGTGTTALYHAPKVAHVEASDISPKMIEIARDKAAAADVSNVTFTVSSIDALDLPVASYDVVLAHSILHLVADVPAALAKLRTALKPGGVLTSSTACIGDTAAWLGWVAPLGRAIGVLPRINVFTEATFRQWIIEAGFEIESVWTSKPGAGPYFVARATDSAPRLG